MQTQPAAPWIVVLDEPLLGSDEFSDLLSGYRGKPLTADSIKSIERDITSYLKAKGQKLVDVVVPEQNIANGQLRLGVMVGRYDLFRLLITGDEAKASHYPTPLGAGQIVLDQAPVFESQDFAVAMSPYFGGAITDETVKRLISSLSAYLKLHDMLLAHVYIPTQDISTGEFRIGVALGRYPLRRLIIADTPSKAASAAPSEGEGPLVLRDEQVLSTPEFSDLVAPYLGQPITHESIERLLAAINGYFSRHDRPVVNVAVATENLGKGEVRIAAAVGHYKDLVFRGNKWFGQDVLTSRLGINPGEEVRTSTLESAINWANQNPFRQVQVLINTLNGQPGLADLNVAVQERMPYRFAVSYDDTGNSVIGNNHYTGSLQFGNLWGREHQATYQYTTTDAGHLYRSHSGEYRLPLPWRHYLVLTGAYATFHPTFGQGHFDVLGKNLIADLRYLVPVARGAWSLEYSAGVDFKQSNNNLLFGGFYQVYDTANDIAQLTASVTAVRHDTRGSWTFAGNGYFSPGGFNSRNTDASFNQAPNLGTQARYGYATVVAQRVTTLPRDFQLFNRAQLQLSSARLLGSEQLSIGGTATVRGYNERIYSGDQGWILSTELRGPDMAWQVPILPKNFRPLQFRPLVFWDYARVSYKHTLISDFNLDPLMSTGVGLRSNLASNFNLSADYGWQLLDTTYPQPRRDRGHIQVTFAY